MKRPYRRRPGNRGLQALPRLPPAAVETLIHGAPQLARPLSAGAEEARATLARAEAVLAQQQQQEENATMQKAERDARDLAAKYGLTVESMNKDSIGALRAVYVTPKGNKHSFLFSMRTGSDNNGQNEQAVRRWLREVEPELLELKPAKKAKVSPPAAPTAFALALQKAAQAAEAPKALTPLDALTAVVMAPAPAPSEPPAPTQTVLQLVPPPPTTNTDGVTTMEDSKKDRTPRKIRPHERNVLTDNQIIKLVRWLEQRGPFPEYIEPKTLAAEAEGALGFKLTGRNIEGALRSGEIPFPSKPIPGAVAPKDLHEALAVIKQLQDAQAVIVSALISHLGKWDESVPNELYAIEDRALAPRKLAAVG
jgi:hypothetical protein